MATGAIPAPGAAATTPPRRRSGDGEEQPIGEMGGRSVIIEGGRPHEREEISEIHEGGGLYRERGGRGVSTAEGKVGPGAIFCNFVIDAAGNIAHRVFAAYGALFDGPKQILFGGYATLWQGFNSLTSPREKPGPTGPVTSRLREAVALNCLALQEGIARLAGDVIKVINPNACVDSDFVKKFEQGLVGGRIFSRNCALMELRCKAEKREDGSLKKGPGSFSFWQEHKIFEMYAYRKGNLVTNFIVQELGARVVAVVSATVAIIVAAASIALGAIAFTFAILLSLGKNVSDLVTYSRNGGGKHIGDYCAYNKEGHFYEVLDVKGRGIRGTHLMFEQITQLVTLFAIDNLAEVGTLVNQVHTLGLGIVRPSLLVSDLVVVPKIYEDIQ